VQTLARHQGLCHSDHSVEMLVDQTSCVSHDARPAYVRDLEQFSDAFYVAEGAKVRKGRLRKLSRVGVPCAKIDDVKVAERFGQTDDHALAHDPRYSPLSGCPRYSTRPADHDFTKHIASWLDRR